MVRQETNKLKRGWIWFWYNDFTRFGVLFGVPALCITIFCAYFFGIGEYLRTIAAWAYVLFFGWAMFDNDYSNLRRIGLDEYRRKIKVDTTEKF